MYRRVGDRQARAAGARGMSEVVGPCRPFGQLCTERAVLLHRCDNGGGVGYHHPPPPREVVGRESDAVRGAVGLVPGTGVPGEEAPEAWVASVGTAVFGPTRMHVCVRGCRTPHQEGLQPPGFLDVLSSGVRAVPPSRSVTRPVPTEAVSIRRGRFPRLDSHMVSVLRAGTSEL